MDQDSEREIKTRRARALRRNPDRSSSEAQQSASPAEIVRTRRNNRKASPEKKTQQRKRRRVSEVAGLSNSSEEDGRDRGGKRKVREDEKRPLKKTLKKKSDKESVSCSVDTGRESSGGSPLEGSSTSVEDVRNRSGKKKKKKKKATGDAEQIRKRRRLGLEDAKKEVSLDEKKAEFEAKYKEENPLGQGGCASVFAGYRKADNLPVAIKHVPVDKIFCKHVDQNGRKLSVEVAIMLKLAARTTGSVGTSAPVSLLDWYDLDQELILVLERPVPAEDLLKHKEVNGGSLQEEEAKTILKQLVDAAIELQNKHIFHRDIKIENILIETGSNVPRVRLIDFGLSCFVKKRSFFRLFYGTPNHIPPEWYSCWTYRAGPTTVWQLGVVLFETLHEETSFETTKFIRNDLEIRSGLSQNCLNFLQTCLSKVPEQRPTLEELRLHPWLS